MINITRVLFIMHMPPPVHGAAMMGKYIHDSKLINESFYCHYINFTTATSLEDIGKGGISKAMRFLRLLRKIRREVKRLKPDLVYITPNAAAPAFYKDFIVVQMLKGMGCKVVAHYHNKGVSRRQDKWLDDKLYRRFFKGLKVILLADSLYLDVKKYVRREDVYICPNGIPETVGPKPSARRNNKFPRLLFLSNLIESKGVFVLLDALKILKDRRYSFICDFVGGATAEIDVDRFNDETAKRGLNQIAVYKGRKYGAEKEECFANADVFVFPTSYPNECFPLVLLEAMEHGVPCISTNEGGISGIIEDGRTGFVVEKRNPQMLAEKIICLIEHPELCTAIGKAGRKRFDDEFTLEKFEEKMKDILTNCMSLTKV